jgi:DNA-binding NarL/FixJ family response regulator
VAAALGSVRVLLVDDDARFLEVLRGLLEQDERMEVVGTAASGEEGLRLAPTVRPDVITMDLEMPGMGGVEATRRLKELLPETRVIIVSAFAEADQADRARAAGASAFVTKMRVPELLIGVILAVVGGENEVVP